MGKTREREGTLHPPLHTCDSCARGQTLYQCLVEEEAGIFTVITPHPPTHPSIQDTQSSPPPTAAVPRALPQYLCEGASECRGRWGECSSYREGRLRQPGQDVSNGYFVAVLFPW